MRLRQAAGCPPAGTIYPDCPDNDRFLHGATLVARCAPWTPTRAIRYRYVVLVPADGIADATAAESPVRLPSLFCCAEQLFRMLLCMPNHVRGQPVQVENAIALRIFGSQFVFIQRGDELNKTRACGPGLRQG